MHREVTTAWSVADYDDLEKKGFRPVRPGIRFHMLQNRNKGTVLYGAGAEYSPGALMQRTVKEKSDGPSLRR